MSGPERIWVEDGEDCPYFYFESELADVGSPLVEYIRRDPAVLAALPEVQAMIRQAVEAEREACAVMFDAEGDDREADASRFRSGSDPHFNRMQICKIMRGCAAAIRKRGEGKA